MARAYEEALRRTWQVRPGVIGWLSAVGHKSIGSRFIGTAIFFMLLGGLDSMVLRAQLAVPNNDLIDPQTFSQLFTTHGTAMMFLFAVPIVEGLGVYLVPLMVGARDMPFPRLNALGYYLYLFGGLMVYAPTLADVGNFFLPGEPLPRWIPDAGWFAYPPLSGREYSPDPGMDIWLIGLTLAEISAVFAATELIVTILRCRAPGMTMGRMPLFVWSILGMSVAIILAFPSLIAGGTMLELQRQLGLPFFDPSRGGDPLLWQHLFWIFGHPEVYVMFLPATGVVSMVIPVFARRPMIGYGLIVVAILTTAALSLGLWIHHMFATGLPWLGLTIFSAASMIIAIPSGIQVFAWLATMLRGRRLVFSTPMLFSIGFIVTFVLGGLTGVMVASVPFDLQAHDTYFVVAHFHYVLVGGVLFPVFAAIYFWLGKITGRRLDDRWGRASFWLQFIGFNLAFLPQHSLGLLGMVRRVYTYPDDGWLPLLNLMSSVGAWVMGVGVLVALADIAWSLRRPPAADNPWRGQSLEWAVSSPPPFENFATIPVIRTREPLWSDAGLRWSAAPPADELPSADAVASADAPPSPAELPREMLGTTVVTGEPVEARWLPSGTIVPFLAAVFVALAGVATIFSIYPAAALALTVAGLLIIVWMWPAAAERSMASVGWSLAEWRLPAHTSGARSMPWWGLMSGLVALTFGALSLLFAPLYLSISAISWTPATPDPLQPLIVVGAAAVAALAALVARGLLGSGRAGAPAVLVVLVGLGAGGLVMATVQTATIAETQSAAIEAAQLLVHAFATLVLAVVLAASMIVALQAALGYFTSRRLMAVDHLVVLWSYAALVWLAVLVVNHLLPTLA